MIKLPIGVNINNLIDDLRIFSWEAAEVLLYYSRIIKNSDRKREIIQTKISEEPVTLADLEVNKLIICRLKEKYQKTNWEILSEENVKNNSNHCDLNQDWCWVLDPLDGTKDFIQGTGNYAMHLALNYKQKPYIGVVLIPERDELWFASKGRIWCERREGGISKPRISREKDLSEMTIVCSKNHRNEKLEKIIKRVKFNKVIVMGSIGCKLASIVRGESDIYISVNMPGESGPKDWDFAAPEAVLKAAGGAITNINNEDLVYGKKNFEHSGIIVASNNDQIHKNICLKLKETLKAYSIYP